MLEQKAQTEDHNRPAEDIYPPRGEANYALAILLIAYIFSFIDRQILSLLVEPIRQDLGVTDFQISLLQGMAFVVFYVALGIPIGMLADRRSRKWIISAGIFVWSIMTAVCGLARTYSVLFLARVGVGVGEATLSPATYSILADYFPPRLLARATSIFTMGITIGAGLAYIVGGAIVDMVAKSGPIAFPIVGELRAWQIAFIAVGLPGVLVSILAATIKEPPRLGVLKTDKEKKADMSLGAVWRYVAPRWGAYMSVILAITCLALFSYGYLSWFPTFLIRTYELSIGDVGFRFGILYLIFGTSGALSGALFSEKLRARGMIDANPRTIFFVAIGLTPLAFGPLAPTASLALAAAAPTIFLLNAFFGVSVASLQLITPNQMRAVISAVFLFITNLIGLGVGASLIASLTDFVFGDPLALRYSLICVGVIVCPCAAIVVYSGLGAYRRALKDAAAWMET